MYQIGASMGDVFGPILFKSKDAPLYRPGLAGVLGVFAACGALTV